MATEIPTTILTINGVTLATNEVEEYTISYAKLWKGAERNMNGDISSTLIGVFPNIDVKTTKLSFNKASSLSAAINAAYFSVSFYDTQTQTTKTANFYAADHEITFLNKCTIGQVTVQLVPVSKANYIQYNQTQRKNKKDYKMTTKSQQQDEIVNTFVSSIPTMQTDIALLKQDMVSVKKNGETVLDRLDKLSVVSKSDFEQYKRDEIKWKEDFMDQLDIRFKNTETFVEDNKQGIKFANALVSRWVTFLVLLLLTAAVVIIVGRFIPIGSAGV